MIHSKSTCQIHGIRLPFKCELSLIMISEIHFGDSLYWFNVLKKQ